MAGKRKPSRLLPAGAPYSRGLSGGRAPARGQVAAAQPSGHHGRDLPARQALGDRDLDDVRRHALLQRVERRAEAHVLPEHVGAGLQLVAAPLEARAQLEEGRARHHAASAPAARRSARGWTRAGPPRAHARRRRPRRAGTARRGTRPRRRAPRRPRAARRSGPSAAVARDRPARATASGGGAVSCRASPSQSRSPSPSVRRASRSRRAAARSSGERPPGTGGGPPLTRGGAPRRGPGSSRAGGRRRASRGRRRLRCARRVGL